MAGAIEYESSQANRQLRNWLALIGYILAGGVILVEGARLAVIAHLPPGIPNMGRAMVPYQVAAILVIISAVLLAWGCCELQLLGKRAPWILFAYGVLGIIGSVIPYITSIVHSMGLGNATALGSIFQPIGVVFQTQAFSVVSLLLVWQLAFAGGSVDEYPAIYLAPRQLRRALLILGYATLACDVVLLGRVKWLANMIWQLHNPPLWEMVNVWADVLWFVAPVFLAISCWGLQCRRRWARGIVFLYGACTIVQIALETIYDLHYTHVATIRINGDSERLWATISMMVAMTAPILPACVLPAMLLVYFKVCPPGDGKIDYQPAFPVVQEPPP